MIIPSVNFLKSNFSFNSSQYQHQPDRPHIHKKYHAISRILRFSAFLAAGLTCLVIGSAATPAVAQERVISQFSDRNSERDVRAIQDALRRLGYFNYPQNTGIFGEFTQRAVLDFQRDNNLPITGAVDNITANRIFAKVQENARNNPQDTRAIQDGLRRLGYNITVDGILGSQTQQALISFQQANNLPVTGVADRITSEAIFTRDRGVFTTLNPNLPDTRERFCRDQNNRNQICAYVVLIPGDNNRLIEIRDRLLLNYRPLAENLVLEDHGRGLFIRIDQYRDRGEAEVVANLLRNNISPDFRVEFLPTVTPISTRG